MPNTRFIVFDHGALDDRYDERLITEQPARGLARTGAGRHKIGRWLSGVALLFVLSVIAALVLAFANGANDNIKGVATLIGGRTMTFKKALAFAAMTTYLGSVLAVALAQGLLSKFSGKGLVDPEVCASPTFLS